MATNLTDGSGYLWDIQDNGSITGGTSDAYDGGMVLVNYYPTALPVLEDFNREVVLGSYTSGQISIVRKVYVPSTGTGFARFLEIVTNTGTTATTYNLGISTNLGSDSSTHVINTSSGDAVFTTADKWIITDDVAGSGDPAVAHIFAGTGGLAPSSVSQSTDIITYNYNLSLSPGQTKIIAHFGVQSNSQADELAAVNYIQQQPAAIFSGMSIQEIAQVVNYVTTPTINATYSIETTSLSQGYEGDTSTTSFTFAVSRSGVTSGAGTVSYSVLGSGTHAADASDFSGNALPSGTVSFAAGETTKMVTLHIAGDTTSESDETFTVTLQNATAGSVSTTKDHAIGTILNDDLTHLTDHDDLYTGSANADMIHGLSGDDLLKGLDGNDVLVGGSGDDTLDGGSGNDILVGSSGDDHLYGGSGDDVLYAATSPRWGGDETQTTSASGVIPSTNQTLAINMSGPIATDSGSVTVEGLVSRSTAANNQYNIVYVIDHSGSMSSSFSGSETVPDVNSDGSANTMMDAAILSFESLNTSLANNGFSTSRLGIIQFDDTAQIIYNGKIIADVNNNGRSDAADALRTITYNGSTYYDTALQKAIEFFQAAPSGNNIVFFISDGYPNGGVYTDEVATLLDRNGISATIRAIGLGSGASLTSLDLVDDGLANNTATIVNSPSSLTSGLIAPPVSSADISRVEILKEGVVVASIPASQLISTPLGLKYSMSINGLNLDDNTLTVRVIATDAAHTSVSTSLHVSIGDSNNFLYGGSGNDILFGGSGTDLLDGGSGIDEISYDQTGKSVNVNLSITDYQDTLGAGLDKLVSIENVTGTNFNDILTGNSTANTLKGGAGNDILNGGAGNDILDGGAGNDIMVGGTGNDIYFVNSAGDIVTELVSAGTDTVQSSITYTLGVNVENLTLTGAAAINGTGNTLDNVIIGNTGNNILNGLAGNDILDGGAGNDRLIGGSGNDTYVVDSAGDIVTELVSAGTDTVQSSITYTLGANVENLTLTGVAAINGTGNTLGNILTGNSGNNILSGGAGNDILIGGNGNDTLTGGSGSDYFVFNTAPNASSNKDIVTDFVTGVDHLQFSKGVFAGLGSIVGNLSVAQFWSAAGAVAAHDSTDRIIYNTATGALYYDADGIGGTAAVQVAIIGAVSHPVLAYTDISIVA